MDPLTVIIICIILILAIRNYPVLIERKKQRTARKNYLSYRDQFNEEQKKAKEEYDRQRKNMVKI